MSACCSLIYIFFFGSFSLSHTLLFMKCCFHVFNACAFVMYFCTHFWLDSFEFCGLGFHQLHVMKEKKIRAKADIFPEEWKKTHTLAMLSFPTFIEQAICCCSWLTQKNRHKYSAGIFVDTILIDDVDNDFAVFFLLPASAASIHFECDFIERQTEREKEQNTRIIPFHWEIC